ncbi:MAG: hypothetical protein R6U68_09090, partial [Desulfobacteraceae bacterium]
PDESKMAFVKRVRTKSVLYIRDLETGIERPVYDEMSYDQQQAWAIFGPYTNFSWTPDGVSLVPEYTPVHEDFKFLQQRSR